MIIIFFFNKRVTCITYFKQFINILPSVILAFVTGGLIVYIINFLPQGENLLKLLVGGLSGVIIYLLLSIIFRVKEKSLILNLIKSKLNKN